MWMARIKLGDIPVRMENIPLAQPSHACLLGFMVPGFVLNDVFEKKNIAQGQF